MASTVDVGAERGYKLGIKTKTEGRTMGREEIFQAMGRDLDLCDMGQAMTTGKHRAAFTRQRKDIFNELKRKNEEDGPIVANCIIEPFTG